MKKEKVKPPWKTNISKINKQVTNALSFWMDSTDFIYSDVTITLQRYKTQIYFNEQLR